LASQVEQEALDLINSRLDGEALIRAIGYHTDKLRLLGKSLKTPCFVHQDERFATLIVMPEKGTGKCMVNTCPAFVEQTLTGLFGLWKGLDGLDAALGAAELTGIDMTGEIFEKLLEDCRQKAGEYKEQGNTVESLRFLLRASRVAPANPQVALTAARSLEAEGDTQQALALYRKAARNFLAGGDPIEGERILREDAARLAPNDRHVIEQLATLLSESGQSAQAVHELITAAETLSDSAEAALLLDRAEVISPAAPEPMLARARLLRQQGQGERAVELFGRAADLFIERGDFTTARKALQGAVEAAPLRADLLEILIDASSRDNALADLADFLEKLAESTANSTTLLLTAARARSESQGPVAAKPLFEKVIEQLEREKDDDAVRALYEELAEQSGTASEWCESFADWLARKGDSSRAVTLLQGRIKALSASQDTSSDVLRLLDRLVQLDDSSAENHRALARACLDIPDPGRAAKHYLRASALHADAQDGERALSVLEELVAEVPTSSEGVAALTASLLASENPDAAARLQSIANDLCQRECHAQALPVYRQLAHLHPEDEDITEQLARTLEATGERAEAAGLWQQLAEARRDRGDKERANVAYSEASRIDPINLSVLENWTGFLDQSGDLEMFRTVAGQLLAASQEVGDQERVESVIRMLSDRFPGDQIVAREIAAIEFRRGNIAAGSGRLATTAAALSRDGDKIGAVGLLLKIVEVDPANDGAKRQILSLLQESSDQPAAREALLALAALEFRHDRASSALDCIARYEALAGGRWQLLRQSCDLLVANKMTDRAVLAIRGLLKAKSTADDDACAACEFGLELAPAETFFAEKLFALHDKAGRREAALVAGLQLADLLTGQGEQKRALKHLESLKEQFPAEAEPRLRLANIHQVASRKREAKAEWIALADFYREASKLTDAREALTRALELDGNDFDTGLKLAACHEALNERDQATAVLRRLGGQAAASRTWDRACELYEKLLELTPENLEVRGDYVGCLSHAERKEEAAAEALKLVHRFLSLGDASAACRWAVEATRFLPESLETPLDAAELLARHGNHDEAATLLADVAQSHLDSGRNEDAAALLTRGLANAPDHPALLDASAKVAQDSGNQSIALERLRRLAAVHDKAGRLKEAEATWNRVLELEPESVTDLEELIGVLQRQGPSRKKEAIEALRRLSGFYLKRGSTAEVITCYQRQLEINPHLLDIREQLARACLEAERLKEATSHFLVLAMAHRKAGKLKLAIDYIGKVIELEPQNMDALWTQVELTRSEGRLSEFADYSLRLASLQEAAGRIEESIRTVRAVVEADRENVDVRPILAAYLVKGGDLQEGVCTYFETARHHLAHKKPAKAVEVLDRVRALETLPLPILESLGELYLSAGQDATSLSVLRTAAEEARKTGDAETLERICGKLVPVLQKDNRASEALEWQMHLVRVQISKGMVEPARLRLESLSESRHKDQIFHEMVANLWTESGIPELAGQSELLVARLRMEEGDWRTAADWCRRAISSRPREITGREMLVQCLREMGDTVQACTILSQLADLFEESMQPDLAAEVMARALEIRPEDPGYLERSADLLQKVGRVDEMAGTLRVLAQVHEKLNDPEAAIEVLRRLKMFRPDDTRIRANYIRLNKEVGREKIVFDDLVHLASLYLQQGNRDSATASLREAAALDSYRPEAREKLLGIYIEDSNTPQAVQTALELAETYIAIDAFREGLFALQRVKRLAGEDPRINEAAAKVHIAQNARGMALREYEEAARLYADRNNRPKQAEIITRIIQIDPQNLDIRHELIECLREQDKLSEATEAQRALAEAYAARELWDLAEAEYRSIIALDPGDMEAWQALFHAHVQIGEESDLIPDYLQVSRTLLAEDQINDTLHYLGKVIDLNPRNMEARELYIEAYKRVGRESELCEEYLLLADLYVDSGRIDDGIDLYNRVISIDPENKVVRERLTETQARRRAKESAARRASAEAVPMLSADFPNTGQESDISSVPRSSGAAEFLAEELESLEEDDQNETLQQVINSYKDILGINPQSANVRIKLAELYLQRNERDQALEELRAASETFLAKGEINPCIAVCERILKMVPTDQKVRLRLKQAFNKRDAFKALESAILFTDAAGEGKETVADPGRPARDRQDQK
jgi:tetratricopeptide (TPR) repeat protein